MTPALLRLMAGQGGYRGRLTGPEDELVMRFANDLRAWTLEGKLRAVWNKVQSESAWVSRKTGGAEVDRAMSRVRKAKAMGAITGAWELWFVWSDGGGVIEAKRAKGQLTPEQKDYGEWLKLTGCRHAIMRTPEQGREILQGWGVLRLRDGR